MTTTLNIIDLAPRGKKIIDLLGNDNATTWRPFGSCFSTWVEEEDRPALGQAIKDAEKIAMSLRTRAAATALVASLGIETYDAKLEDLRLTIQIFLIEKWFPITFLNEKPDDAASVPCRIGPARNVTVERPTCWHYTCQQAAKTE